MPLPLADAGAARLHASSRRLRRRSPAAALLAAIAAAGLAAVAGIAQGFAAGDFGSRQHLRGHRVRRGAEDTDAPPNKDLIKSIKSNFNVPQDTFVDNAEFATPFDGLFGFGKSGGEDKTIDEEDFVDSSDEANYVTVTLEKPFGMGVGEATDEGGAMVTEVKPGSNAEASGEIQPSYQLIAVEDQPVYGKPVDEIIQTIAAKEGALRLTFFKGEAKFFYGKLGPSSSWLAAFVDNLSEY